MIDGKETSPPMREDEILTHPSWTRSYKIVPHVPNGDGTWQYRLTFNDGQKVFFTPETVDWPEVSRSVSMWEKMCER